MEKIKLEKKILELPILNLKSDNLFLIKTFPELTNALKNIKMDFLLKFFFLNRDIIKKILYEKDTNLKIVNENINHDIFQSFYYLFYIIYDDIYNINYSYDFDIINKIYSFISQEQLELRKFIISIFAITIIFNFEGINELDNFKEKDKLRTIYSNIKEFILQPKPMLTELNLNLDLKNFETFNINKIYSKIIISLIKKKKFEDFEYSKNIFEQLDLKNIELTQEMYLEIKNEFDKNSDKEYIKCYQIINFESLINRATVDFYFLLFTYIFKVSIYIYNIEFLLCARNKILEICRKNNFNELLLNINQEENKDKINYILKMFLDVEYIYLSNNILCEVLKYFENFFFDSKTKEINEIKKIINEGYNCDFNKYLPYYEISKKYNKRYKIIKFLFDQHKSSKATREYIKLIKQWKVTEDLINNEKIGKIKDKKYLFTFFRDVNNRKYLEQIFDSEKIDGFIKKYIIRENLAIIRDYYNIFFFESKKNDITKIVNFLKFNKKLKKHDIEEYLKEEDKAKEFKTKYKLINNLFSSNNNLKSENEIKSNNEMWDQIKKMLEEKNIDTLDDKIKIILFKFFQNKERKDNYNQLLNKNSYNFLLEQIIKAKNEILEYYKYFKPESKKEEIQMIENEYLDEKIFDDYTLAKFMNLRRPLIFLLLDSKNNNNERDINQALDKWKEIEEEINKRQYENIDKDIGYKLIKFFQKSKNEFIEKIFKKEIIEEFKETEEKVSENSSKTTVTSEKNNKIKVKDKKKKGHRSFQINLKSNANKKKNISPTDSSVSIQRIGEKKEEKKEVKKLKKSQIYLDKILKSDLIINLKKENGENNIKIKFKEKFIFSVNESDIIYCKENFSNNKNSDGYIIFDYLNEFITKLKNEYKNENSFKLELHIEKEKENKNFIFSYKFIPQSKDDSSSTIDDPSLPKDKPSPSKCETHYFKDINYVSEGFEYLKEEINNVKYKLDKKEGEKEEIIKNYEQNQKTKVKENNEEENDYNNSKDSQDGNRTKAFTTFDTTNKSSYERSIDENNKIAEEHKIIEFIRIIGDHNPNGGKHSAEFIKEIIGLINDNAYISGGNDKYFKIYSNEFFEDRMVVAQCYPVYNICQEIRDDNSISFYASSSQRLFLYNCSNSEPGKEGSPVPIDDNDRNCSSVLEISKTEYKYLIVAGKNGVNFYTIPKNNPQQKKEKKLITPKAYRGLIEIDENRIALTSNRVIPGGENKMFIYNLQEKETEELIGENYSFIATSNGMSIFNINEERYLICACKSYNDHNKKNGILLFKIEKSFNDNNDNNDNIKDFYDTEEIEVYCFCQIMEIMKIKEIKDKNKNDNLELDINCQNIYNKGTEFFLVGGFDKILREGKIKLFMLKKDNNKRKIQFLQDIEIEKNNKWTEKEEEEFQSKKPDIKEEENKEKKEELKVPDNKKFYGFHGAISSIIQSSSRKNILVSCYDGKIYLFTKPNLSLYVQNTKK